MAAWDESADVERLARMAAAGEASALDALLVAVQPEVLRLCARFLPCRQDAEEACQDTLLAVARGIGSFQQRASFRTWLYRVAANRSRSTYQALRRRWQAEQVGVPLPEPADPQRTSVVAGSRLDLLDGLNAMPPEFAEPVALRDVLAMSYREMAEVLGVPEGTVKSRLHEGRRQLRSRLSGGSAR